MKATIDGALFAQLEPLQLLGGRCSNCGIVEFPRRTACPACASVAVEDHPLSRVGTLWSWTVQRYPPPSPPYPAAAAADFAPYAVGYVALPSEVMVETRLVGEVDTFNIGDQMELVALDLIGEDSSEVVGFGFARVAGGTQ